MNVDHLAALYLDGIRLGIEHTLHQMAGCESVHERTAVTERMAMLWTEMGQKLKAVADETRTDEHGRRLHHAVPRPVGQSMHTGEFDSDITTLCGIRPGDVAAFSITPRYVTCPECRAAEGFALLKDEVRA